MRCHRIGGSDNRTTGSSTRQDTQKWTYRSIGCGGKGGIQENIGAYGYNRIAYVILPFKVAIRIIAFPMIDTFGEYLSLFLLLLITEASI